MYSPLRHWPSILWKRRPIQLTFFLTRRCNARCPFCFYLRSNDGRDSATAELTLQEIEKAARSLKNLLWLAFSGGEVYLRKDLVEISEAFYRHNRPAIMLFPTNGLTPELIRERTEQILQRCPESVIAVKLSIDGLHADHDRLRDTPGSFNKTLDTYERLRDLLDRHPNFELGVNTVFLSQNQDKMDEIMDFVDTIPGIRTHTISLVRGDLVNGDCKDVDLGKYQSAVSRLARDLRSERPRTYRFNGARLKAAQDVLQRRLIHDTMTAQRRLLPCYAGRANLVLTEIGEVYPCEIRKDGFGNIRDYDYDIGKVCDTPAAKRTLASIRDRECYCSHECYFMTNILLNPCQYPALLNEYRQVMHA